MATVKGPFEIRWGANPIVLVSEVNSNFDQDSDEQKTIDGANITFDGAMSASVEVTLLSNDVPALAALLPQYYVAQGGTLSTGESVTGLDGAIDVKAASCDTSNTYDNLDVVSCGNPGQVYRLVNARTTVSSIDFEATHRTVTITFIGEPASGEGVVQFFASDGINPIS